jgi:hypothetical protein
MRSSNLFDLFIYLLRKPVALQAALDCGTIIKRYSTYLKAAPDSTPNKK